MKCKLFDLSGEIISMEKQEYADGRRYVKVVVEIQEGYRIQVETSYATQSTLENLKARDPQKAKGYEYAKKKRTDLVWDLCEGEHFEFRVSEWEDLKHCQRFEINRVGRVSSCPLD